MANEICVNIEKGSRVRAHWFQATNPPSSLSGNQFKLGVMEKTFTGRVMHIYGYADSKEDAQNGKYKKMTVIVRVDDSKEEIEIDQRHIVEVLPP